MGTNWENCTIGRSHIQLNPKLAQKPVECITSSYLVAKVGDRERLIFHCIENRSDRWMDQVNYSSSYLNAEEVSDHRDAKYIVARKEVKMSHEY